MSIQERAVEPRVIDSIRVGVSGEILHPCLHGLARDLLSNPPFDPDAAFQVNINRDLLDAYAGGNVYMPKNVRLVLARSDGNRVPLSGRHTQQSIAPLGVGRRL